jgi:hypothetical protein
VVVPSQAVYLYVQTTEPSQVTGLGTETEPIKTGTTDPPQASKIFAGAPGFTAAARHATV